MSTKARSFRHVAVAGVLAVTVAACGGDDSSSDTLLPDIANQGGVSVSEDGDGNVVVGGAAAGSVSVMAEPGKAWAEADGQRFEYEASGSIGYECIISSDLVSVNYQTGGGHNLMVRLANQGDGWFGSIAFTPEGEPSSPIVAYGADIPGGGEPGLSDSAFSFEGSGTRVEDFDLVNATEIPIKVAANCESAGDPVVAVGGEEFVFSASGAQSVECEIAEDNVSVMINRLASDDQNLQISGRVESVGWLGNVTVMSGDHQYQATFPNDTGLFEVDGQTVTYDGPFLHTLRSDPDSEEELPGTAMATCG